VVVGPDGTGDTRGWTRSHPGRPARPARPKVPAVIEITRFRPRPGVKEADLQRADKSVQEDFAYQQPGLLRRTTAKSGQGWVVIALWRSHADADAASARWENDPVAQGFVELIERDSVRSERYDELG
jgi:hypothetical protein